MRRSFSGPLHQYLRDSDLNRQQEVVGVSKKRLAIEDSDLGWV